MASQDFSSQLSFQRETIGDGGTKGTSGDGGRNQGTSGDEDITQETDREGG